MSERMMAGRGSMKPPRTVPFTISGQQSIGVNRGLVPEAFMPPAKLL